MFKKWKFLLISTLMVLVLVGCGESSSNSNSNSNSNTSKNVKENKVTEIKSNPTAWVGEWVLEDKEAEKSETQTDQSVKLEISNNVDQKFDFEFKQAGETISKGSANLINDHQYILNANDCMINFSEQNLNLEVLVYGSGEACSNLDFLMDDNQTWREEFVRVPTKLVNFQQILFLTPEQDLALVTLLGEGLYKELVEKYSEFKPLNTNEKMAKSYINTDSDNPENDGKLLIMTNPYNLFWVAYEKNDTLNYYTNYRWLTDLLPETIESNFSTANVNYVNMDNVREFEPETFKLFPILNEDYNMDYLEIHSTENYGGFTIGTYYNYGIDSQYQHGNYVAFLNELYKSMEVTLTLEEGNEALVYFVDDSFVKKNVDDYRNFDGNVLASYGVSTNLPSITLDVDLSFVTELNIVVVSNYDDDAKVSLDISRLSSHMYDDE
ncbi:hypothetical protein [Ureibacillus xyleni]|uniref:hypothetical protein n=1 Tax=Ureibacillus xyleni TaxID=614648 RepID=UPI00114364AA|nr:hypothetical protein [Ureibacillus xyleni]